MKNRNIALISAFTIAATLVTPTSFINSALASSTDTPTTVSSQVTTSRLPYDVAAPVLNLNGGFNITFIPSKYATFQVNVYDNTTNVLKSTLSYSGSSPHTISKSDTSLRGYHTIVVTSNVPQAGTISVN